MSWSARLLATVHNQAEKLRNISDSPHQEQINQVKININTDDLTTKFHQDVHSQLFEKLRNPMKEFGNTNGLSLKEVAENKTPGDATHPNPELGQPGHIRKPDSYLPLVTDRDKVGALNTEIAKLETEYNTKIASAFHSWNQQLHAYQDGNTSHTISPEAKLQAIHTSYEKFTNELANTHAGYKNKIADFCRDKAATFGLAYFGTAESDDKNKFIDALKNGAESAHANLVENQKKQADQARLNAETAIANQLHSLIKLGAALEIQSIQPVIAAQEEAAKKPDEETKLTVKFNPETKLLKDGNYLTHHNKEIVLTDRVATANFSWSDINFPGNKLKENIRDQIKTLDGGEKTKGNHVIIHVHPESEVTTKRTLQKLYSASWRVAREEGKIVDIAKNDTHICRPTNKDLAWDRERMAKLERKAALARKDEKNIPRIEEQLEIGKTKLTNAVTELKTLKEQLAFDSPQKQEANGVIFVDLDKARANFNKILDKLPEGNEKTALRGVVTTVLNADHFMGIPTREETKYAFQQELERAINTAGNSLAPTSASVQHFKANIDLAVDGPTAAQAKTLLEKSDKLTDAIDNQLKEIGKFSEAYPLKSSDQKAAFAKAQDGHLNDVEKVRDEQKQVLRDVSQRASAHGQDSDPTSRAEWGAISDTANAANAKIAGQADTLNKAHQEILNVQPPVNNVALGQSH